MPAPQACDCCAPESRLSQLRTEPTVRESWTLASCGVVLFSMSGIVEQRLSTPNNRFGPTEKTRCFLLATDKADKWASINHFPRNGLHLVLRLQCQAGQIISNTNRADAAAVGTDAARIINKVDRTLTLYLNSSSSTTSLPQLCGHLSHHRDNDVLPPQYHLHHVVSQLSGP